MFQTLNYAIFVACFIICVQALYIPENQHGIRVRRNLIPNSQDIMDGIINLALDAFQRVSEIQETISGISGK
ncbi:hypothetical protein QE152_g25951 [Popillia japonica]|uniref:Uncharacterized protein n=1 Tax=Popillia japonica TaxID=7064 RepID=A0AAW1K174_POPJA